MRTFDVLPMDEPPGLPPAESDEAYRERLILEGRRLKLSREQLNKVLRRAGVEPIAMPPAKEVPHA